ncbi:MULTISPECIES: molybdopterin-dependent oxidoreductase [unclassified Streptomyces]|uniref:molybdopterin-dependent oxidoreductase n=1 Tax=unclassified Streptomyces TaxID=2593676 RepID=UPI001165587E|nr:MULTISPECIES: molybdopterin-dependent oxidoreductase [unclassified Streptomyces]NMI55094.1 molybdopterin-dependent oxidoreductase [Streptomyces sp. RLA2-12]QDN62411.1 molybdopterin-dependent oxidoreductase [Streptomyces sp. S1D4-20]QDN72462.1 molybdopterin-dependent oxidoreductase [Streptomyces sp. S1D4-14]QDO54990.1 molybdopterin-dependent oxidoreductase [Streptomyces sp. RLB3-5]QDO65164.1 molybdopterin-dependent oxidoreductase [Streptomyces sp. RLB1-8]
MGGDHPGAPGSTPTAPRRVPPGQRHVHGWPVSHYGPVPRFRPDRWNLRVFGATAGGDERTWSSEEFTALPHTTVVADLHCATGPTSTDQEWFGIAATTVLDLAPPSPDVTHVMAWAEYGYAANLRLRDFTAPETLLATHHNGELLTAEHGFPLRLVVPHLYGYKSPKWLRGIEYLTEDRRGFWEARGYHNVGDPWKEQRYSHQEREGEGPAL